MIRGTDEIRRRLGWTDEPCAEASLPLLFAFPARAIAVPTQAILFKTKATLFKKPKFKMLR